MDYDSDPFAFKIKSFGPIRRTGSGSSSSEDLKENNRNEKADRCCLRATIATDTTLKFYFNLLKPSGNFTYHQV
jgi:hypothetical protein